MKCRLGTRGSRLARWQADWVAAQLAGIGVDVEIVRITTTGDARQRGPIEQIGSQGVFTKEIQRALLSGEIDVAVHLEQIHLVVLPRRPAARVIGHLASDHVLLQAHRPTGLLDFVQWLPLLR